MSTFHSPKTRSRRDLPLAPVYTPSQPEVDALIDILVMCYESPEAFRELLQTNLARYRPADGVEFGLVEEITAYNWRARRGWVVETFLHTAQCQRQPASSPKSAQLNHAIAKSAEICASHASTSALQRQEARLQIMFQRALRTLVLLKKEFPVPPQSQAPLPSTLHIVAPAEGETSQAPRPDPHSDPVPNPPGSLL